MTALIFALMKENYVSEQGARMISMEGASKNAGEMISKLALQFNRMRQAVSFTIYYLTTCKNYRFSNTKKNILFEQKFFENLTIHVISKGGDGFDIPMGIYGKTEQKTFYEQLIFLKSHISWKDTRPVKLF
jgi:hypothetical protein